MLGAATAMPAPSSAMTYEEVISDPLLHEGHSQVLRLYQAVLGRTPDAGGAIFWLNEYDSSDWTTRRIADHFVNSLEFEAVFGSNLDNSAFTEVAYRNVLEREPDGTGFTFWLGQLEAGMPRSEMVLLISNSPEFIARFPLPSDARPDRGPRYPGLGTFRSLEAVCIEYSSRTGTTPPEPERFSGAVYNGSPGSGETVILDGLGDDLVLFDLGAGDPVVILRGNNAIPQVYLDGCPPELFG